MNNSTLLAIIAVGLGLLLIFTDPVDIITSWYKKHADAREAKRAANEAIDDPDGIEEEEL